MSQPFLPEFPLANDLCETEVPVSWTVALCRAKSRGRVTLDATNIDNPPVIDYQMLTHPDDMVAMIEGMI